MRLRRNEVPVELTWNLHDLFPSHEAWEAEGKAIEADLPAVTQYKGRLAEGPATLAAALKAFETLLERMVRWGTYANLLASGDGSDPENQGMLAKAYALQAQFMAATAFIKSEILALPEGQAAAWMAADPELAVYRPALEQVLIERPYKLHPQTEEALAALSEVSEAPFIIYERARSSDMTFEPITAPDGRSLPVSFSLYEDELELSADTAVRRAAFDSFTRGLKAYQNTLAATFATEVKKNIVLSRLRGYESVTHMLLAPHRIDHGVYHNLLDVIQSELAPHMRRYARLRKRVLGLDEMRYCDIEAPLDPGYNPQVTREEAANLILDALSVLGPEYRAIIERAFNERWIDWADNVGKQAGAFCTSPYGAHSYILLTFTGHMRSAFTLAHELGHAGHFELANRHQRLLNVEPSLFFVEAPSTMNEVLLADHILKGTDDKRMRRWVITQLLMTYHHNFVRHLLEAELQRRIYAQAEKGVPVTAQLLSETKGAILEQFWGGEVVIDEGAKLTWMRQPHYYMGLYPYTYSAGLTCGTLMAQRIKEEGQPAAEQWVEVLKLGGSLPPMELMARAGVDMTSPEPIRKAIAYVGSLIDELEASF
ncbi:oligoendopeptidase F [Symbiobacterium thermophilum]|uniref:Oligopeptidase F n=1 Tax=Symbiobacterium thermophilum (strain DSM 24528 / JCM 14929 / IAM 14863 / T) TaxID=292459 RepID=Q67LM6_SYMTH|nr:oligoendopeptidase F [Symbiobacterium thermophilum]BAD41420.1 oligoendopeptidase [Symbiobacterium thermophilum IAM 14863]